MTARSGRTTVSTWADPSPARTTRRPRQVIELRPARPGSLGGWLALALGRLALWLAAALLRLVIRFPRTSAALAGLVLVAATVGLWPLYLACGVAVVVLVGWRLVLPGSFGRLAAPRLRGWVRRWVVYAPRWGHLMARHHLTMRDGEVEVWPRLVRVRATRWQDSLLVALRHGQGPATFERVSEEFAHARRAADCRVRVATPGRIWLDLLVKDPLAAVIPALPIPASAEQVDLTAVPVGRREDGGLWTVRLAGTHVLVAGATGAGKASVLWSVLRQLAPAIAGGLVQVWAVDPKGGIKVYPGQALFTRYADRDPAEMVELLEDVVAFLQARARRLRAAGVRVLTPSVAEPFVLVVVDELASLTAYLTDRRLSSRVDAALQLLTSQGRAAGVGLLAALQDPSKDVLPYRHLFPTRIALRLDEAVQADMVLGDGARDRGAVCDRIPASLAGVGYVKVDGVREPVRVRAGWVTDTQIGQLAAAYPAPTPAAALAVDPAAAGDLPAEQPATLALPDDDADAYLSDDELSAEWAAYARAHRDRHPPGGGPPG